ncbi:Dynein heavy chain 6, axonemal [Merluccius polli]|uniref:Dynein heavy chain 6, axonemal n=1 Tax=Merluccius polli TaxID=89951 RepID=A0AA47NV09_MERPO|nr:Dynein heavy chain 6, axonemal [Merluccius polli]
MSMFSAGRRGSQQQQPTFRDPAEGIQQAAKRPAILPAIVKDEQRTLLREPAAAAVRTHARERMLLPPGWNRAPPPARERPPKRAHHAGTLPGQPEKRVSVKCRDGPEQHCTSPLSSHTPACLHENHEAITPPMSSPVSTSLPSLPERRLHFSCVEEVMGAGVHSPPDIVRILRSNPHLGFLYMMPAVPKSSIDYDPFNLKITTYENVPKNNFLTVSPEGVLSTTEDTYDFVPLEGWEREYHLHRRLLRIPTFALFPKWRAFRLWRTNVRAKKIHKARALLQQRLFIVDKSLRPALMDIREMCHRLSDLSLCQMEANRTYTLQEFQETQHKQLEEVSARLEEFRQLVKEVAIFVRLIDYLVVHTMCTLMGNSVARLLTVFQGQVGQTPGQATIRSWGQHETTMEAPSEEEATDEEEDEEEEAVATLKSGGDDGSASLSMFTTELRLDTHILTYQPSADQFQETIGEIIRHFQETVLSVDTFVADDYFNSFTQPIINNKVEEKTCGEGPCLESILEDDINLQSIIQNIKQSLQVAFDSANVYSCTFEHFRNFYKENESLDLNELRTHDHGAVPDINIIIIIIMHIQYIHYKQRKEQSKCKYHVAFAQHERFGYVQSFGKSLEKYHSQYRQALAIEQHRQLGLLLVDTTQLKNNLTPSPLRCLEAINEILPLLAKKMLDAIVSEAQDAQFKLQFTPSATTEFVNSLTFLDEIQERVRDFIFYLTFFYNYFTFYFSYNVLHFILILFFPILIPFFIVILIIVITLVFILIVFVFYVILFVIVTIVILIIVFFIVIIVVIIIAVIAIVISILILFVAIIMLIAFVSFVADAFIHSVIHSRSPPLLSCPPFVPLPSSIQVTVLEEQQEIVCQMYKLIEMYSVPTPPEDFAVFAILRPSVTAVQTAIEKSMTERDANVDKFCAYLQKDVKELNQEVKAVKQKAQDCQILDIATDPSRVRLLLGQIQISIDELQGQASTYISYQKKFQVEVTEFNALEELSAEVKLKRLLWDSLEEWDSIHDSWMQSAFDQLDPEQLSAQVNKYAKSVSQLEKGLPPNSAVPCLKRKVDAMREKLPVITDLRNPCLKSRHWEILESVVDASLTEEPLSLTTLERLDVFSYGAEIQEVSGQASGEASLETIIKKVEDSWKATEFTVLSHRDAKDVFILGGTDDIQVLLDDSIINIATVASSRHVGPIKAKVDDWHKKLALFSHTLDECLMCQRNWLYLESIFSAPDIQRELAAESKMFQQVDKSWKEIMRKVNRHPNALRAATQPGLLEIFQNNNALLDQIQKCLEAYLESKRVIFPRFYFLSNDELLEILAQTRNPQAVQPHLRKCFDSVTRLEFALAPADAGPPPPGVPTEGAAGGGERERVYSNDILAMVSPEGEKVCRWLAAAAAAVVGVGLTKGLKARGNVEDWLCKVEEAMFSSLRRLSKAAIADYQDRSREEWVVAGHPSQVVLTVSQVMWCRDLDGCLQGDHDHFEALQEFEIINFERLNVLAALVRGHLPSLHRNIITALITVDVHARDIVTDLVRQKVDCSSNFEWQRQLRYYWDLELDNCIATMALSTYVYGYEYLGACPRLVITPLTDRCYLCLMGALQLDLGGAPAGPAGTGKTETTKDLAKALAIQCVVFNCSDGLDYKMMGRFFSGLAQSGAWCCFDEFNRIDIEVLSVIAQQLITIRNAKAAKMSRFMFEGREIKLVMSCAAFITMNPGYAGRTELPDNLKALFRPIAMMVPNYTLIAEVILYSEGFESSKTLARKMTQMYKLCSEQLSQQDHYDFGMRAVKSVLVMAGSLKRENPQLSEDVVLIRALRDSNLPKFLTDDAVLFGGILSDLFPGVCIPEHDYGVLHSTILESLVKRNLQPLASMTSKVNMRRRKKWT